MDIKQYIDKMDDIAHLERHEQFNVLEKAKKAGESQYKLISYSALTFVIPIFSIALCGLIYYVVAGFSSLLPLVAIIVGLLVSRVTIINLDESLMRNGLKIVLSQTTGQSSKDSE